MSQAPRSRLRQPLLKPTRAAFWPWELVLLALFTPAHPEKLALALLAAVPFVDAAAEACAIVSTDAVIEFFAFAFDVAVADAVAVVVSACAPTSTLLRNSDFACPFVSVSPE